MTEAARRLLKDIADSPPAVIPSGSRRPVRANVAANEKTATLKVHLRRASRGTRTVRSRCCCCSASACAWAALPPSQ